MKPRIGPARLEDLPNVGPATAGDLRALGITVPSRLIGRDPYKMYDRLCALTGVRHDPCVIDVFLACVRFMEGAPARPWWAYTAERKRTLAGRESSRSGRSVRKVAGPAKRRASTR
jgi:hypothetical protein